MEKLILNPLKEAKILVFLFVFIIILIILILLLSLKIQIQVSNFRFTSQTKKHINKEYSIIIKFYTLNKIPILKSIINREKIQKIKSNEIIKNKIQNVDFKLIQNTNKFDKKIIEAIKQINLEIKNINLIIDFGTENASFTAIGVSIIATLLSIVLRKNSKKYENLKYIVNPVYINQNLINIAFSGIFEIKMIHIINIIYILSKKEGVKKYERTSNRRPYDYSYE